MADLAASDAAEIAIVDGASFVLPYDHGLISGLLRQGRRVAFFASRTRYNAECLDDLRGRAGVRVIDAAVSGSVAPRWRGVPAYALLLLKLVAQRRRLAAVNLQFSVLWPLELPLLWLLRDRLVYTVHNAVPHGFAGLQHAPTRRLAALARQLVFVSQATMDDFLLRYGEAFRARSQLLRHGLLPIRPGAPALPVRVCEQPQALVFWGTVRGYKGIGLFAELARSPAWRASGLTLEVHGRWDTELHPLRDELQSLGVHIADRYLAAAELQALTERPVLFALPYTDASQSGALYTLLNQGCTFVCSDTGDLGAFLRRHELPELLLPERSVAAVIAVVNQLRSQAADIARRLQAAQDLSTWDRALADAAPLFSRLPA